MRACRDERLPARPRRALGPALGHVSADLTAGAARSRYGRRDDDARHPVRLHQLRRARDTVAGALPCLGGVASHASVVAPGRQPGARAPARGRRAGATRNVPQPPYAGAAPAGLSVAADAYAPAAFVAAQWLTAEGETQRSPLRKFVAGALTGMTSTICTCVPAASSRRDAQRVAALFGSCVAAGSRRRCASQVPDRRGARTHGGCAQGRGAKRGFGVS